MTDTVRFDELAPGDVFEWEGSVYLKVRTREGPRFDQWLGEMWEEHAAICLDAGSMWSSDGCGPSAQVAPRPDITKAIAEAVCQR